MPKRAITDLFVDQISPPKTGRVEYWDTRQPGLCLRVSASGVKSWCVMYWATDRDGRRKQVRETLGSARQIRPAAARRLALASSEQARAGAHPVEERRIAAARSEANTVAAAAERYLAQRERGLRPKTVRHYRQIFAHDVLPLWGKRPLADIRKGDVLELLNDKAAGRQRRRDDLKGGAVVQANRILTRLRTFFAWAIANDLVTADPTAGVMKPGEEKPRDRVLSDAEIRAFWAATEDTTRANAIPFGAILRLLLLTGQREGETAGMRWSEIDIENSQWEIPAARTKNGKAHIVHLGELALEVLAGVPRIDGRDLVFSGNGETPATGFSRAKARLDRRMAAAGSAAAPWVLHDLRRTAATKLAELGIAQHVVEKVLNHTSGKLGGLAGVYNRYAYLPERRAALEAWGRFVAELVQPGTAGNVVELRARGVSETPGQ